MEINSLGSFVHSLGGNALKYYASCRIDIRRTGAIKDGEEVVGATSRIKVVKNKVFPPFREAEPSIMYAIAGFDKVSDLLDIAAEKSVVEKSGAWYAYKGSKLGQGKANSVQFLRDTPAVLDQIKADLSVFFSPLTAGELPVD